MCIGREVVVFPFELEAILPGFTEVGLVQRCINVVSRPSTKFPVDE